MGTKQFSTGEQLTVGFSTRVIIDDPDTKELFLDKSNAIHSQNMARAIARGLSDENNSIIYRIAFGNGGSSIDAAQNVVLNPPNDGTRGEGWESRLYNEVYSEILSGPFVGQDPGSVGPDNIRIGGGSVPEEDSPINSVNSVEVGRKSNIIATVTLNKSEPVSQLPSTVGPGLISVPEETVFQFDEIGFYTSGKGAAPKPATVRINIGVQNSDSLLPNSLPREVPLIFNIILDGIQRFTTIEIPSNGLGSGPSGQITYGDLCEGFNSGDWLTGDPINSDVEMLITNISTTNTYNSILGVETFGMLVLSTKNAPGSSRSISANCDAGSFFELVSITGCGGIESSNGEDIGVLNDPTNPENERERLLTHLTFPPILKKFGRKIRIRYILTVSVAQVSDTVVDISSENNMSPPVEPPPMDSR